MDDFRRFNIWIYLHGARTWNSIKLLYIRTKRLIFFWIPMEIQKWKIDYRMKKIGKRLKVLYIRDGLKWDDELEKGMFGRGKERPMRTPEFKKLVERKEND